MFVKGQGVYSKLDSIAHPSNLRILYECIPLAFLIEKAGGVSSDLERSILDIPISGFQQVSTFIVGSSEDVEYIVKTLKEE